MLEITTKHKERYFATHRALRRTIAEQVLDIVLATGARFLKREEKEGDEYWEEVSRSVAYDKVSHALRNKKCRMPGDKLRRIKPRYRSNESQCNQSRRNVPDLTQGVDTLVFRRDPNLASLSGSNMLPPSVLQPSILNHQILAAGLMPGLAAPLLSSPPLLSPLLLHPGFVGSSLDSTYAHGLPRSQLNRYDSLDRLIRARMVESLLRESDQPDFRHLGSGGG